MEAKAKPFLHFANEVGVPFSLKFRINFFLLRRRSRNAPSWLILYGEGFP